jgi:endoglucanase Acf2
MATLIPIAEEYRLDESAARLAERVRLRLEGWLTATGADGRPKDRGLFAHDDRWGTLIGYPAAYGSDTELNDHHFQYGYFLKAAAEVARRDPSWGARDRWGGMVELLIRDFACPDRDDRLFPFLRNFSPTPAIPGPRATPGSRTATTRSRRRRP